MVKKKKAPLDKAHILVADQDILMVDILRQTLYYMGLTNVTHVRSGREALSILTQKSVDILITEWKMTPMDGLTLIKTIRKSENANLAMLPVVMLTARAELNDVIEARDMGATEFLVKPFTAKTLFEHLEHIIDFPRNFIVSEPYIGPDRRRSKRKAAGEERRKTLPVIIVEPRKMPIKTSVIPHKIIPNNSLRVKLGIVEGLSAIITPAILEKAQQQIAEFQDAALQWIARDLQVLEQSIQDLYRGNGMESLNQCRDALLSIRSHSGTFDFILASNLAFSFYSFMHNKFTFGNEQHLLIARKHVEVLKILLARQVKGLGGSLEQELVEGLSLLTNKLQDVDE